MNLVAGQNDAVFLWLERKHGVRPRHPSITFGTIDGQGVLRGAFVITAMNDTTAELHVYGKTSNDTFKQMFRSVFGYLGVYRLEVRVSKRNKITKRAAPKFGFTFSGCAKHFYGQGHDALVFFMTPETCRWLKTDADAKAA